MKKSILLSIALILFLSLSLKSQEQKKYSGKYINGITEPAEATYSYYDSQNNLGKIKHGSFRYSVKSKNKNSRFYQNINGSFVHNFKNGTWNYKLNFRDYYKTADNFYETGVISLIANYKNGIPDGKWTFQSVIKKRKRLSKGAKIEWDRYLPETKINMQINFKDGILVDSVKIYSSDGVELDGIFDKKGFFDKNWIYKKGNIEEVTEYAHGLKNSITTKNILDGKTINTSIFADEIKRMEIYKSSKSIGELPFTVETNSLIKNKNLYLVKMILNKIYNDSYFIYKYIPGDKCYYFKGTNFVFDVKGAYELSFSNKITNAQIQKLMELNKVKNKIDNINNLSQKLLKTPNLQETTKNRIKTINYNTAKVKKIICLTSFVINQLDVKEGIKNAKINCNKKHFAKIDLPEFKTKEEAIDFFIDQSKKLLKESESHYEYIIKE